MPTKKNLTNRTSTSEYGTAGTNYTAPDGYRSVLQPGWNLDEAS